MDSEVPLPLPERLDPPAAAAGDDDFVAQPRTAGDVPELEGGASTGRPLLKCSQYLGGVPPPGGGLACNAS